MLLATGALAQVEALSGSGQNGNARVMGWGTLASFTVPDGWQVGANGGTAVLSGQGVSYAASLGPTSVAPAAFGAALLDSLRQLYAGFEVETELEGLVHLVPTIRLYWEAGDDDSGHWRGLTMATPMNGLALVRGILVRKGEDGQLPEETWNAGVDWLVDGFTIGDPLTMRSWVEGLPDVMARAKSDEGGNWLILRNQRVKIWLPENWTWSMAAPSDCPECVHPQLQGPAGTTITVWGRNPNSHFPDSGTEEMEISRRYCEDHHDTCPDCSFVGEFPEEHHPDLGAVKLRFTCDDSWHIVEHLFFRKRGEHLVIEWDGDQRDGTWGIEESLLFLE